MPTTGITQPITWSAEGQCQIDWALVKEDLIGTITISGDTSPIAPVKFSIPAFSTKKVLGVDNGDMSTGKLRFFLGQTGELGSFENNVRLTQSLKRQSHKDLTLGDQNRSVLLIVNGIRLEAVQIKDSVLTYYRNDGNGNINQIWTDLNDGLGTITCANQSQYLLKPIGK